MKKNIISALAAASAALLLSVSCSKQESIQSAGGARTFTASIEQGLTRTTLFDVNRIQWNENDLICINGISKYSAIPTDDVTTADFKFVSGAEPTSPYVAYYPYSLVDPEDGPTFPNTQIYEKGRFNAPMYAQGTDENLEFKNICGVIRLSLKLAGEGAKEDMVRKIKVFYEGSSSTLLWGPFSVDDAYNAVINKDKAPKITIGMPAEENPGIITLDCGVEGVAININDFTDFFIYLPPIPNYEDNALRFKVFNTAGGTDSFVVGSGAFAIERNTLYPLTFDRVIFESEDQESEAQESEAQGEAAAQEEKK